MNFMIVGSGPAGIFAAEAIRKRDKESPVTIVTAGENLAHSPVMLSYWMAGNSSREVLSFRDSSWFEKTMIDVRPSSPAASLNLSSRKLVLADGDEVDYDRLLIATGASPIPLPIPGIKSKGAASLRTLHDAETILEESHGVRDVVIIGGGFIGLKLACHLKERGLNITVLEKESKLAVRMFDRKASKIIEENLRKQGIGIETNVEVAEVLHERGWVTGVRTKEDLTFTCQRIIVAVGVRPNVQWLAGSGIEINGGILVNERMETNVPGVYAAGDVVMTLDSINSGRVNNATWPSATRQGIIAGTNMAGGNLTHACNFSMNALNLFGLQMVAAGHSYYDEDGEMDILLEERDDRYRKIVMKGGRIIGFILIGDISGAGLLLSRMKRRDEMTPELRDILSSSRFLDRNLPPNLGFHHGLIFTGKGDPS
jgi:nitrite reductase (NADH) large subunit